ncbi:MAG TPA: serine/threonine-protein kinase [Sumerlaeia bacterium]|nr:serine/threonine-protein kinase [Sumerlaeia bacterium]
MREIALEETPDERKVGKYVIVSEVARGGMGQVLKGRDPGSDRAVAIKVLRKGLLADAQAVARFRREAASVARLRHPNVAHVYDSGATEDGQPYIVMELVNGPTLEQLIRQRTSLNLTLMIDLALQTCQGLRAAYLENVIHCDVKPGNLIMDSRSHQLKIVDFGLSRILWEQRPEGAPPPKLAGTPRYMSPEQCRNLGLDLRSDVYSAGGTFYHLFAAQPPYEADTDAELIQLHLSSTPIPLRERNPDVPDDLNDVVMRMLARDPNDRYQDYDTLISDLDAVKLAQIARAEARQPAPPATEAGSGAAAAAVSSAAPAERRDLGLDRGLKVSVRNETEQDTTRKGRFHPVVLVAGIVILVLGAISFFFRPGEEARGPQETKGLISRITKSIANRVLPAGSAEKKDPELIQFYENFLRMRAVSVAVNAYLSQKGAYPVSLGEVREEGSIASDKTDDAWGAPMVIYSTRTVIISFGPDGVEGTDDDWEMEFAGALVRAPEKLFKQLAEEGTYSRKGRRR